MQPLTRYALLQIPGWAFVGLVITLLLYWEWIDRTAALVVLGLWLLKDGLLYPLYRPALGGHGAKAPGAAALVGNAGRCRTEVNGRGMVEIHGERWLARAADGNIIPPGARVEVVDHDGMTLMVRRPAVAEDPADA